MRLVILGGCMVLLSLFSFVLGSVFLHGKDAAVKPKVTQTVEAVAESVSAEFPDTLQEILLLTHQDENKKRNIERQKICETVESDFFCGSLSDDKTNVLLTGDSFWARWRKCDGRGISGREPNSRCSWWLSTSAGCDASVPRAESLP